MFIESRIESLLAGRYEIGIVTNTLEELIAGEPLNIRLVKHNYKDRWFADPFVLDITDSHIELLVEEYYYPEQKGRIAKLRIDRNTLQVVNNTTVLNINTHLSFPVIRRIGNSIFVIPENGQSGKLISYKYDQESETLVPNKDLIGLSLADAVDVEIDGCNYLFCTVCPDHSGKVLSIYKNNKNGYEPYQTYQFNENIARMAGDFFTVNGKLYRPCQDCNDRYGYGFLIQEITQNGQFFDFKTVARYSSPLRRWNLGLHTLNSYKSVIVTDVLGYTAHPSITKWLGYTLGAIRRLKHSLKV